MNKYHIITLILCLFCLGGAATASPDRTAAAPDTQARSSQLKVSGIIKDDAGSPLIGVTIVVKGTSSGSVSNSDGSYTITVPYAEATLMVSYIGYAPQEINVNNRTRIDITMVEDSKALEEVVVVGYNVQKKETITGSISTITTKDLKQSPTANINNALAGRMPGLLVNQFNGGEPGNDAAQLNIRGKSTYGKSDVIMIVDGIERDMSYLSPDEIETFTILKDASATAPYGIRGANGVIIVTTKRGRKGEKPTVDFKASVGVSEPIRYPDYLGSADYATLYNEAMLNDNPSLDPGSASLFSQETISNFRRAKGDNSDGLGYNWDYFDYAFKPSILQDYSLSVRGGTDRARYFILGSYYNQGGNYKHSNSDNVNKFLRYNFRANVDVDATKRLKISVDLGARVTEYNYPGATAANIISLANTQPPYLPIILPNNHNDVNQADFEENGGYLLYADNDYRYNMLGQLNRTGFSKRTRRYLQGSFKLSHDLDFITKGLSVAAQFSYDTYNQHTINNSVPTHSTGNLTYPGYSTWMLPTEYSIDEWKNNADYWIKNGTYVTANQRTTDDAQSNSISHGSPEGTSRFQARLDYARKFGDHNVSGMLLFYLQNKVISNQVPFRYMGFSGRATYDYRNKYLFEFNIGYNGSENFAPGKRFGFFPSVAAGWVVSNEPFWRVIKDKVNLLKFRVSYGLVGNDVISSEYADRFPYLTTVDMDQGYDVYIGTNHIRKYGPILSVYGNPDATWEESRKLDVGVEIGLFDSLNIIFDWFKEKRSGIFMQRASLPSSFGMSNITPWANIGKVDNRGVDISIDYNKAFSKDLILSLRGSFTYAHNEVVEMDEPAYKWDYLSKVGHPINSINCLIAEGLFQDEEEIASSPSQAAYATEFPLKPGDIKFKDLNGDRVIDDNDKCWYGNPTVPEIIYGFGFSLKYKGFDCSAFFQGQGKVSIIMYDSHPFGTKATPGGGLMQWMADEHWREEAPDPNARYPRLSPEWNTNNTQANSLYVRNGRMLRLKNAEIGYTYKFMRVYVSGTNLLTFSPFKYWDPEKGSGNGLSYPLQRTCNLGFQFTF